MSGPNAQNLVEAENPFEQENVETKDMHTVLDLQEKKSIVNKSIVQVRKEIFIILHSTHFFHSITIQCSDSSISFSYKTKVDSKFEPWMAWTACSTTCGNGTRIRRRICSEAVGSGKECPDTFTEYHLYKETEKCHVKLCIGITTFVNFMQRLVF